MIHLSFTMWGSHIDLIIGGKSQLMHIPHWSTCMAVQTCLSSYLFFFIHLAFAFMSHSISVNFSLNMTIIIGSKEYYIFVVGT